MAISLVALVVAASGGAYAAATRSSGAIVACVHHKGGGLYIAHKCARHDKRLKWNMAGVPGARGPQGPQGPATGPAGGALSGNYPNPTLAARAVGTANFGTIPSATLVGAVAGISVPSTLPSANSSTQVCLGAVANDTDGLTVAGGGSTGCASGQDAGLKAPVAGEYLITSGLTWPSNATGTRQMAVSVSGSSSEIAESQSGANTDALAFTVQTASGVVALAAGQTVTMSVSQHLGSSLGLPVGDSRTFLSMTWLGPS